MNQDVDDRAREVPSGDRFSAEVRGDGAVRLHGALLCAASVLVVVASGLNTRVVLDGVGLDPYTTRSTLWRIVVDDGFARETGWSPLGPALTLCALVGFAGGVQALSSRRGREVSRLGMVGAGLVGGLTLAAVVSTIPMMGDPNPVSYGAGLWLLAVAFVIALAALTIGLWAADAAATGPSAPVEHPAGGRGKDLAAAVALLSAAVVALTGSFLDLFNTDRSLAQTTWGLHTSGAASFDPQGIALAAGSLAGVAAAAVLCTRRSTRSRRVHMFALAAAGLEFSTSLTIALKTAGVWSKGRPVDFSEFGPGFPVLLAAVVVASVALLLTSTAARRV